MRIESRHYVKGEKVRHVSRPEWGLGVVESAEVVSHDGRKVQRLIVTFENRGRCTVNTAFAPIIPADKAPEPVADLPTSEDSGGWLAELEEKNTKRELYDLPDVVDDPFSSLGQKIYAVLDLYRFTQDPRGLIDWAVAQTGEKDPLTKHSRHELEIAYDQFCRKRDASLIELVKEAKKNNDQKALAQAGQHTHPIAQDVFTKALRKAAKSR